MRGPRGSYPPPRRPRVPRRWPVPDLHPPRQALPTPLQPGDPGGAGEFTNTRPEAGTRRPLDQLGPAGLRARAEEQWGALGRAERGPAGHTYQPPPGVGRCGLFNAGLLVPSRRTLGNVVSPLRPSRLVLPQNTDSELFIALYCRGTQIW